MSKKIRDIKSQGDSEYFKKIFDEYFKALSYYAIKFTRDHDSAKDIVHSVFISLWEKRHDISIDQPLKSYLYTSVHNRCLNYLRDRAKFYEADSSDLELQESMSDPGYPDIETIELETRINEAINLLPEKCKQVFKLNRFEDKKYSEIADMLNISVKTVEAQISKALKLLREELKDYLIVLIIIIGKLF